MSLWCAKGLKNTYLKPSKKHVAEREYGKYRWKHQGGDTFRERQDGGQVQHVLWHLPSLDVYFICENSFKGLPGASNQRCRHCHSCKLKYGNISGAGLYKESSMWEEKLAVKVCKVLSWSGRLQTCIESTMKKQKLKYILFKWQDTRIRI
jgi:hypothetical protein